jgi:hypothetical protein
MTKYLSAVLVLAAALTGIIGDTHNEENGVTPLGLGAIIVAVLSFLVIVVETYRDHREINWQERQRREIEGVAHRQIVEAVKQLLVPFYVVLHEVWKKNSRRGLVDLEKVSDERYLLHTLALPAIRVEFQTMDLRVSPGVYPPKIWWEYFAEYAILGSERLNNAAAKYSAHLSSRTLIALEDLRADEMVGMRLPRLKDIVMANEHLPKLTLEHALSGRGDYAAFDKMLSRVGVLLNLAR